MLLEMKADLKAKNSHGETPLQLAQRVNSPPSMIQLLKSAIMSTCMADLRRYAQSQQLSLPSNLRFGQLMSFSLPLNLISWY